MRLQGFVGINLLAKQIQSSFNKGLHLFTALFTACHCLLISSKRLLGPTTYLMIYKCQLTRWLCSLAVKISDVPCTGEVVSLFTKKTGNCLTFFGLHHCKKL